MARSVVFRPEAEGEALETSQWYESRRPGLGQEFAEQLALIVGRIAEHPTTFPSIHHGTRRAVLRRFPYAVYFRETSDTVVVLAIHGRQHPSRWQRR